MVLSLKTLEDSQGPGFASQTSGKDLQGTTELLLTIANSMPIPMIVSSPADGTIPYSNDLCCQAFVYSIQVDRRPKKPPCFKLADHRGNVVATPPATDTSRQTEVRLKKS